jgi:prolyl-tRNA editing enzyme YbaK/EbsC (Cys-tRNA(Pro) deacylase)
MPPSEIFWFEVVIDPALKEDEHIYFNAGNH